MDEGKSHASYDHAKVHVECYLYGIPGCDNTEISSDAIREKFKKSDKAQTETLINDFTTLKQMAMAMFVSIFHE